MSRLARLCGTLPAGLLAAALLASPAVAQVPRDVVVVGMEAEPPGLDPGQALGLHTLRVTAEIFETLVATRPDSTEVIPGLAESWTTSPDGMIWTFKLRRGVRFHDGTPLDAAAVKFTFDRVIDPTHPHAKSGKWSFVTGYLSSVKSVEVLDPQTVQLHLKYPTGSLPALLALPNCAIVSPTAFTKAPADFDTKPVGSGRYKFESWERGSRLVLRRNDDYWGVKGKPQALVYRGIPEANTRVSELLTGGVDLILPIPPDFVERLEKTSGVTVHKATGLTVWYAGFNVEKKPFTDRRVRQAFNHAVNKDAIVRDILKGTGIPAVGPLLPGTWAFEPNVHKYPYNPGLARKLLAEAGYPNGLEVDFWVPESGSGMQAPVEMSTVIQANLAAVGVKAPLKTFEWGSYLGKVRSDAPALFALSWFLKSEDPDLSMYPLFFSKNQPLPNRSNYNNPEVDQLLVQARQLTDRAKRAELYRKAQRLIVEDAPWLFVDHEVQVVATRANVKGFHLHPSGFDLRVENVTKE
jgi:peptide/nickel transport system substrate-binding protein